MADPVEYESRGPVVTLWLNRPEVKNAYDLGLLEALADGLTRAEEDEDARLVVVSGRGDAFCAYVEHYDFIKRLGSEHGTCFGRVVSHPAAGERPAPSSSTRSRSWSGRRRANAVRRSMRSTSTPRSTQALWR